MSTIEQWLQYCEPAVASQLEQQRDDQSLQYSEPEAASLLEQQRRPVATYTVLRAGGRIAARTAERRRLASVVTRRTTNRLRCAPTERALQHNKSASSRGRLPSKAAVD